MVNIVTEICKKELKTRFRTKSIVFPLVIAVGIPLISLVPQLHATVARGEMESAYPLLVMLLMIPAMITAMLGLNAFTNEMRWKTIKSLLAAPVSIKEIFIGKSLACIISGLLAETFLALVILISLPAVDIPILIILLAEGPLLVIFATFLIIAATSRFPNTVEGGIAVYIPMGGIMGIILMSFLLQVFLPVDPVVINALIALITAVLALLIFLIATKWFQRERLVVG